MELWCQYNRRLLETLKPGSYIVTHFDAYFHDPRAELQRVCDFIGMPVSRKRAVRAAGFIDISSRHNRARAGDFMQTKPGTELMLLYRRLCAESGAVFASSGAEVELLQQITAAVGRA